MWYTVLLCLCLGAFYQCRHTAAALPAKLHFFVCIVRSYLATDPRRKSYTRKSTFFARTTESFGALVGTALLGKSQFTMLLVGIAVSRSLERSCSLTGLSQLRKNRLPLNLLIPGDSGLWCFLDSPGSLCELEQAFAELL